ncbi:D-Ala-D-Ala carboxypeptidase family metallohydrolase [Vampirovibrio sp.]|uniref:D-Ala-D-Ala carboxypeptidase family metallohydrolase n=1 Tax=Vampirovibrio sp. TaxID=2717857 RepID=UPI003594784A
MTEDRRNIALTPHFKLSEFLRKEDPMPAAGVLQNIERLANRLQVIREVFNRPILINSGYRSKAHNQAVGGASHSQHLDGLAADIVVAGVPAKTVQQFLQNWSGGMGCYQYYTHLDIRPEKARWT